MSQNGETSETVDPQELLLLAEDLKRLVALRGDMFLTEREAIALHTLAEALDAMAEGESDLSRIGKLAVGYAAEFQSLLQRFESAPPSRTDDTP